MESCQASQLFGLFSLCDVNLCNVKGMDASLIGAIVPPAADIATVAIAGLPPRTGGPGRPQRLTAGTAHGVP